MTQDLQTKLSRLAAPFRRLMWKTTLSYTLVTVAALAVLELLLITGGLISVNRFFRSSLLPRALEQAYGQVIAGALRPHLRASPPDVDALQSVLAQYAEEAPSLTGDGLAQPLGTESPDVVALVVVSPTGEVLAATGPRLAGTQGATYEALPVEGLPPLIAAARDTAPLGRRYVFSDGAVLLASPLLDETGDDLLGVLGWANPVPAVDRSVVRDLLPWIGLSLVAFTLGTGVIGTFFGFLTSRPLVRRLDHLASVSGKWSQGDFTAFVEDEGGDEIAALGRRMNRMAEQLQNLLDARDRLAVVEERNRIARDLHDSVKQQAFAAAGQIGAAKALLDRDVGAAEDRLEEAEELIYALRQELTLLIEELRPAALEEKGLGAALQEYAPRWSRRAGIEIDVRVECDAALALEAEVSFFRIAQETLANVARHSQARHVDLALSCCNGEAKLTVVDDGIGFQPQQVTAGFGLSSLRQRAASLPGGALTLRSAPGEGTTVEVRAAYLRPASMRGVEQEGG
jgi:NarL family two-component system sensor histidine kinase LiaS